MDRSVEHILLRLLTPAFLLFLAAHVAAGILDVNLPRERSGAGGSVVLYFEDGSGAAKVTRPAKIQLRKPRALGAEQEGGRPSFLEVAVAYVSALLVVQAPQGQRNVVLSEDAARPRFAHARTRNPRDPPRS